MKKLLFTLTLFSTNLAFAQQCFNFMVSQQPEVIMGKGVAVPDLKIKFKQLCLESNRATLIAASDDYPFTFEGSLSNDRSNTQYIFEVRTGVGPISHIKMSVVDARMRTYRVSIVPSEYFGGPEVRTNAILVK